MKSCMDKAIYNDCLKFKCCADCDTPCRGKCSALNVDGSCDDDMMEEF